jgi:hypothetical protein
MPGQRLIWANIAGSNRRAVCVNCTATGHLSSSGLFLHLTKVCGHISSSKACFTADLCYKEVHVEALPGNVIAGAGGLVLHLTYITNLQVKQ